MIAPNLKVNGNGQGKILSQEELKLLFNEGLLKSRDRVLFGLCLFTGCRISEALALQTTDIKEGTVNLRKATTKGRKKTRSINVHPSLSLMLDTYIVKPGIMFPGMRGRRITLSRAMADQILRAACDRVGIVGCSTHSFRRTALTQMHRKGVPLRVIQEISGIDSLNVLQRYLEVTDEQKIDAISAIGF